MRTAQAGDRVQVHYVKRLPDGSATSSRKGAPLDVTVGVADRRLPGLGLALVGLTPGKRTRISVPPSMAYGIHDPSRIQRWSRKRFSPDQELAVGKWIRVPMTGRRSRQVRIVELHGETVVVDTNHRGAGQTVEMIVELVAIEPAAHVPDSPDV